MRLIRALGASVALAALLVGVPSFLLAVGDPGYVLDADWETALLVSLDGRLVIALLSLAGWAAWAVIALTVVFEAVAILTRQRVHPRLPGAGWLRPMVAALLAAAAIAPGVVSPGVAAADSGPGADVEVAARAQPGAPTKAAPTAAQPTTRPYVVQPADELWTVAERELGAGERWRELVALNPSLDESSRLAPGSTILLPAGSPAVHTVTVAEDESLWSIAERELGDGSRWPDIHRLNKARISDPDLIDVGWEIVVPGVGVEPEERPDSAPNAAAASATALTAGAAAEVSAAPSPPVPDPAATPAAPAPEGGDVDGTGSVETTADAATASSAVDPSESPDLLGPIGALTAVGVLAGLATRRRAQLVARAVGRRLVGGPPELSRFWTALAGRADSAGPQPADPGPTSLVLGWLEDGKPVTLDLEREGATVLTGRAAESALAAAITGLACAAWSEGVDIVVAGAPEWSEALDDPGIASRDTADAGVAELVRLCSTRRLALGSSSLDSLRQDPETSAAWTPTVVVFAAPPTPAQWDGISDALALGRVGVSVLALSDHPHVPVTVVDVSADEASWEATTFSPQLIDRPTKRALLELFQLTGTPLTEPADWWVDDSSNVRPLPLHTDHEEALAMTTPPSLPEHPTLALLGDVDLRGPAGAAPTRAMGQCLEYCAWLLEHPSASPTSMTRALLVAEATRRSNMSRLRGWLGVAPDGENYLPDAYSGRIRLDERVTSDWERFRTLLSGGVNVAPDAALVEALRLVRGEPLGHFAFQWLWAQQLRCDMVAMIVDAACCLADRALERGDAELAMWAVERGRLASPDSDEVGAREVLSHERIGRHDEAERAALRLSRAARAQGRDIAPDLARRIQLALLGSSAREATPHQPSAL